MGNSNLDSLRQLGAKYWQVVVTFTTAVLTSVKVFYDVRENSPRVQTVVVVAVGLFIIVIIRFPRVAIGLTKVIFGPAPLPPNPPKIFRGPLPYLSGESLPGRQSEVQTCWLALQQKPFLLLEGESGCGKSSILNAALLPFASGSFRVVECRVGEDPFGKLTCALEGKPYRAVDRAYDVQTLLNAVKQAGDDSTETPDGSDKRKPLLICIDQFEELFVTVRDSVRSSFVETLRDIIAGGHARLILGMRSDFTDLLSRLCRTVDAEQQWLNMGSYYTLKAFSASRAGDVLDQMLEPLHKDDPLRKQQLADFSVSLINELLRPPRDKRLNQDDEKTVLPVELQTVGMMLESVGVENFSTEGYRRLGRKAGLLRAYIEEAKSYVWRKTGVSGDQALLILRQLISPARTKWAQTPDSVAKALSLPAEQAKSVLDAFAEKFLVNRLPTESGDCANGNFTLKYELMHEHLVRILVEAPQPILQQARDAEERLQFWRERTEDLFSSPSKGFRRSLPPQPIPVMESLRLQRFATDDHLKRMLTRNFFGFGVRLLIGVALPLALASVGWMLRTRSDSYQVREAVRNAPSGAVAANESSESEIPRVIEWSKALTYANWTDAAFASLRSVRDSNLRADGFTTIAATLAKTGDEDRALAAVKESFTGDDVTWSDDRHVFLAEVAEVFGRADRSEQLLESVRAASAEDVRVNAFWAASEGFIKAGKATDASRAFNEALATANNMKAAEERSAELLALAAKGEAAGRSVEAARALNNARATLISLNNFDRVHTGFKLAAVYAKLNDIDQAVSLANEMLGVKVSVWISDAMDSLSVVVERMAQGGKMQEALGFLMKENLSVARKEEVRWAVFDGLVTAGKIDEALSAIGDTQRPETVVSKLNEASNRLLRKGDITGARRYVKQLFTYLSTLKDWQQRGRELTSYVFPGLTNAVKVGETEMALQLAQELESQSLRSSGTGLTPLAYVALKLVDDDQVDKGLRAADGIKISVMKSPVYRKAAVAFIKAGDFNQAANTLRAAEAFENASEIGTNDRMNDIAFARFINSVLSEVAIAYAQAGKAEDARKVLLMLNDEELRLSSGSRVIWELVGAGKEDDARQIAFNSGNDAVRSQYFADLTEALTKAGKGEKALPILDQIKYPGDSSRARAAVAKWHARTGLFFAARETAQSCSDSDKLDAYTILLTEYAKRRRPEFAAQFEIKERPAFEDEQ